MKTMIAVLVGVTLVCGGSVVAMQQALNGFVQLDCRTQNGFKECHQVGSKAKWFGQVNTKENTK